MRYSVTPTETVAVFFAAAVLSLLHVGCAIAPPGTKFEPTPAASSDDCDERIVFEDVEDGTGELCVYNGVGADLIHGDTYFFVTYDEFCVYICPDAHPSDECLSEPQYWDEDNDDDGELEDYAVCRGKTDELDPIILFWYYDYTVGYYLEMDEALFEFCEYRR